MIMRDLVVSVRWMAVGGASYVKETTRLVVLLEARLALDGNL